MMKLTRFLKELPGVRERMTGRDIKAGHILSAKSMGDLYVSHSHRGPVTLIGPTAGEELLSLYKEGKLPMRPGACIEPAPLIRKYLNDREEFDEEIRLRREIRETAKSPDSLGPEDMQNWHVLECIFRDAGIEGEGALEIAGRSVAKVHSGRPNKPTGADYTFQWEDDDGQTHIVTFSLLQPTKRGFGDPRKAA